jgi:integral membrane protein
MALGPQPSDIPLIRRTLAVFKVSSIVTGLFLLGLVVMMVTRYGFGRDIELLGPDGFLALTPKEELTGINLSIVLLTVHGWLYVVYLACDFVLWRVAYQGARRFAFLRFLWIAMGGIIPFLSFFFERHVPREVETIVSELEPQTTSQEASA